MKQEHVIEAVKNLFREPNFDVEAALEARDLVISEAALPRGYRPLLAVGQTIVGISGVLHYQHFEYSDELALIERCRARGADFYQTLDMLRSHIARGALSDEKAAVMGIKRFMDRDMVLRPYLGNLAWMQREISPQFHHLVLQQTLTSCLSDRVDAVFDMGCGAGDVLAEFAAHSPYADINFYGGDISLNARKCLAHLTALLPKQKIASVPFDIRSPQFDCLQGARNVLFMSNFSLVYSNPFQPSFWDEMLSAAEEVQVVLFEPISFCLPNLTSRPLFERKRAQKYGICENLFATIEALEKGGRVKMLDIVPDLCGLTLINPVSLVRFEKII